MYSGKVKIALILLLSNSEAMSAFCPCARNNKPQELPIKEALGAWFYWALTAILGSSHDQLSNGIQEVSHHRGKKFRLAMRRRKSRRIGTLLIWR
ncbi:MAG: hypothetical protein ACM3TN_15250 [Alphaproteobacteria bacterium]